MSGNAVWDIDQYKTEHESEEHWQLRRSFMVAHKDKFSEERLVCLAQVFANVEFLGCRYPAETMELVAELSQGVADTYRENQKTKLQRTFVKASDAAGAKVKGLKRPAADAAGPSDSPPKIHKWADGQTQQNISCKNDLAVTNPTCTKIEDKKQFDSKTIDFHSGLPSGLEKTFVSSKECPTLRDKELIQHNDSINNAEAIENCNSEEKLVKNSDSKKVCKKITTRVIVKASQKQKIKRDVLRESAKLDVVRAGRFGRLVLVQLDKETNPAHILERSTAACRIPYEKQFEKTGSKQCCTVVINKHKVVSVTDAIKKVAQDVATHCALEKLRDICYTLNVKRPELPDKLIIDKSTITSVEFGYSKESCIPIPKGTALATPLPEDNIGSKLMRCMGWTGGGLGKTEQGIQEPVSVSLRVDRAGLGAQKKHADASFKAKARCYLIKFSSSDLPQNLVLTSDRFSAVERDIVRQTARAIGLQAKVVGRGDDSQVVISRKDSGVLIAAQMLHNGIYENDYHELVKPRNPSSIDYEPKCIEASAFPHLQKSNGGNGEKKSELNGSRKESDGVDQESRHSSKSCKRGGKWSKRGKNFRRGAKRSEKIERQPENQCQLRKYNLEAIAAGPYGTFFLIEHEEGYDHAWRIISSSAKNCFIPISFRMGKTKSGAVCKVFVNHHLLTTSHGISIRNARENAQNEAYEKLKQICYILKVKTRIMSDGNIIEKNITSDNKLSSASAEGNSLDKPLTENIGSKLMRSMGWTGGGLGKDEQGIKEPVGMSKQVKRSGLGLPPTTNSRDGMSSFEKIAKSLLRDYASKNTIFDLVFSSEFSKEERAVMHKQAQALRLKSKSYGQGDNRSLVVSKRRNYCEIVENMLQTGQNSNEQYELIKPPISLPRVTETNVSEHEKEVKCENTQVSQTVLSKNAEFSQSSILKSMDDKSSGYSEICKSEKNVTADKCSVNGQNKTNRARENDKNVEADPFGLLVLVEDENCVTPVQIIERSANGCRIPFKYEYENVGGGMICKLFVNNVLVTSGKEFSKKRAREATVNSGIEKLRNVCYTLKRNVETGNDSLNIIKTLKLPRVKSAGTSNSKSEKSIMCISRRVDRAYLGVGKSPSEISPTLFKNKIRIFLKEYLSESCPYDVIIPPDFSSPERLFIRKTASGLALKTYLHEVSKKDFLVLSKKLSLVETAKAILLSGGNTKPDFHEEVRIV